jgi:hypothetical protein
LVASCQQLKYSAQPELPEKRTVDTKIWKGIATKLV